MYQLFVATSLAASRASGLTVKPRESRLEAKQLQVGVAMETLSVRKEGSAAFLVFERPNVRNALDEPTARAFLAALEQIDKDDSVRVLVIGGKGAFCSGVDLGVLNHVGKGKRWRNLGALVVDLFNPLVIKLLSISKPTVASLDGTAAGAGMSLALACDFRFGTKNSVFVPAFSRLGLGPDTGGSWFLSRLLGPAKALEVVALSKPIRAEAAEKMGLLTWLSTSADTALEQKRCIEEVAQLPRLAVVEMRELFANAQRLTFAEVLDAECVAMQALGETADHVEGVRAFLDKRPPIFTN